MKGSPDDAESQPDQERRLSKYHASKPLAALQYSGLAATNPPPLHMKTVAIGLHPLRCLLNSRPRAFAGWAESAADGVCRDLDFRAGRSAFSTVTPEGRNLGETGAYIRRTPRHPKARALARNMVRGRFC